MVKLVLKNLLKDKFYQLKYLQTDCIFAIGFLYALFKVNL